MNNKSNLIKDTDIVKVKVVRNEAILHNINTCNRRATIKRIGGGRHVNIRTGEIIEETRQVKRGESLYSLIQSNLQLQDLIKENTISLDKILLLTLTYSEKTLDTRKISEDFKLFMKRLRKNIVEFGKIEFINEYELYKDKQGFHIHAILFFNESKRKVFVPYQTINELWSHGAIAIGSPKSFGYYYYLTPLLSKEIKNKNSHLREKAELQMELPAGLNLYRHSKGIMKPVIYTDSYATTQQFLKNSGFEFYDKKIYPNAMKTYRGNQLYYCQEIYKKEANESNETDKRTPI